VPGNNNDRANRVEITVLWVREPLLGIRISRVNSREAEAETNITSRDKKCSFGIRAPHTLV